MVKDYLQNQTFQRMESPALSPDLNPIKHVLATIERCVVSALNSRPQAFVMIKTALQEQLLALSAS